MIAEKIELTNAIQLKALVAELKTTTDANRKKELILAIVDNIANELAPEAKEMVKMFENDQYMTTQGNYGKYMQALSGMQGVYFSAMVKALRKAGAGMGLDSAIQIIKGNY